MKVQQGTTTQHLRCSYVEKAEGMVWRTQASCQIALSLQPCSWDWVWGKVRHTPSRQRCRFHSTLWILSHPPRVKVGRRVILKNLSHKYPFEASNAETKAEQASQDGVMPIFSEFRQPFSCSASRHTQEVSARPASPWTLLFSLWIPGMFSSAGSPSRDASGLSWAEGLGEMSAATSDMFKHQLSNSSPPKGLNYITVHYYETQTEKIIVTQLCKKSEWKSKTLNSATSSKSEED